MRPDDRTTVAHMPRPWNAPLACAFSATLMARPDSVPRRRQSHRGAGRGCEPGNQPRLFDIDFDVVWRAATVEVPAIVPALQSALDVQSRPDTAGVNRGSSRSMLAPSRGLLDRSQKRLDRQPSPRDQTSQRASRDVSVIGHRERCNVTSAGQDNVAATTTRHPPTQALEGRNDLGRPQQRNRRHITRERPPGPCPVSGASPGRAARQCTP